MPHCGHPRLLVTPVCKVRLALYFGFRPFHPLTLRRLPHQNGCSVVCLLSGICCACLFLRFSAGQPCVAMPCWCYWGMAGGTWCWARLAAAPMLATPGIPRRGKCPAHMVMSIRFRCGVRPIPPRSHPRLHMCPTMRITARCVPCSRPRSRWLMLSKFRYWRSRRLSSSHGTTNWCLRRRSGFPPRAARPWADCLILGTHSHRPTPWRRGSPSVSSVAFRAG